MAAGDDNCGGDERPVVTLVRAVMLMVVQVVLMMVLVMMVLLVLPVPLMLLMLVVLVMVVVLRADVMMMVLAKALPVMMMFSCQHSINNLGRKRPEAGGSGTERTKDLSDDLRAYIP